MSPRKGSKRTSPKKVEETEVNFDKKESPTKQDKNKSTGLKLRLKVSSSESTSSLIPVSSVESVKIVPKIKLNFSRSNESVVSEVTKKQPGKRGRPKKDKSAVKAAAIAASQPNELESEERKSRRRAAEEKIKKSASMDSIISSTSNAFEGDTEGEGGKRKRGRKPNNETADNENGKEIKRRRRRGGGSENKLTSSLSLKSSEFIDITEVGPVSTRSTTNNNFVPMIPSALNPQETEFIQRSKTFLNIAMQHDSFLYTSTLANPMEVSAFKSTEDAVEKLMSFHVGIGAGHYNPEELENRAMNTITMDDHMKKYEELQEKYRAVVHDQSTKKVATELLLLEQRLCLEEEKFLLVKLKTEYAAKFMRGSTSSVGFGSSGSSRPSTPSSNNSRPDSVINQ